MGLTADEVCQNNGVLTNGVCECPPGFAGSYCEETGEFFNYTEPSLISNSAVKPKVLFKRLCFEILLTSEKNNDCNWTNTKRKCENEGS